MDDTGRATAAGYIRTGAWGKLVSGHPQSSNATYSELGSFFSAVQESSTNEK